MSFISALMYIICIILCRFIVINLPQKKIFKDLNIGSVLAKCFENVINRIIFSVLKTRDVGDNGMHYPTLQCSK